MPDSAGRGLRGLYVITPEGLATADLLSRTESALSGGAALVQFRAKSLAAEAAREQALALRDLCRKWRIPFIVNDQLELALAIGADGVHLGRGDGDIAAARAAIGTRILGVSCYDDPRLAALAAREGADYVAIGSVFASATKPGAPRAAIGNIAAAREASGLPVVAIGGIDAANAPLAIAAGADMVAVIDAVFGAPDIRAAARALTGHFPSSPQGPSCTNAASSSLNSRSS